MRPPRILFSIRRLMVITATLAVAFGVFRGIGPVTLAMMGLGYGLAMIGLEISTNDGGTSSPRSDRMSSLAALCRDGMTILFNGFILGGVFYFLFVFLLFFLSA
jgi:hypothetical protein